MSAYDDKPWLARYRPGQPAEIAVEFDSALAMFKAAVERNPDGDIVRYFDSRLTLRELDELTDAFAAGITDAGFSPGERAAIYAQNVPQFIIAQIGTWKAGGIAVSINPMNRERELEQLLTDSGATVLVTLQSLYRDVAANVVPRTDVRTVITTSELEYQTRGDQRIFAGVERIECPGTVDMAELLQRFRGQASPAVTLGPDDVAFLTYTSGTTGPPKGVQLSHRNLLAAVEQAGDLCFGLGDLLLEEIVLSDAQLHLEPDLGCQLGRGDRVFRHAVDLCGFRGPDRTVPGTAVRIG